jgi:protein-disulfide isomerase
MNLMNTEHHEEHHPAPAEKEVLTLPVSILVAAVLLSGSIFYYAWSGNRPAAPAGPDNGTPAAATEIPKVGGRDVILGAENAPVTLVEYGDFQCPFCARFYSESEKPIKDTYVKAGKVRLIYRDIAFLGPESTAAGNAAECAKDQGKFWAYHDRLYETEIIDKKENNGNLTRALFLDIASDLGMDIPKFTQCIDTSPYASEMDNNRTGLSAALGGRLGTPAVFINGKEVPGGARPYSEFKAAIEAALAGS